MAFPTEPKTAFYDWLYLTALMQNPELGDVLMDYIGFTDIAFNPKRSINCQARAAALYVAWRNSEMLGDVMRTVESYLQMIGKQQG